MTAEAAPLPLRTWAPDTSAAEGKTVEGAEGLPFPGIPGPPGTGGTNPLGSREDGEWDIYFNRSLNGGATWLLGEKRIDTDPPNLQDSWSPRICCDGARIHIAWYDARNGAGDIYYRATVPE